MSSVLYKVTVLGFHCTCSFSAAYEASSWVGQSSFVAVPSCCGAEVWSEGVCTGVQIVWRT